MGNGAGLQYRLPRTELVVTGTVTTNHDRLAPEDAAPEGELKKIDFRLRTSADDRSTYEYEVAPTGGWLWSYKASFATTDDGRLTTASAESTGHLGTVVTSLAAIAGTVTGMSGVSNVVAGGLRAMHRTGAAGLEATETPDETAAGDGDDGRDPFARLVDASSRELDAYRAKYPAEARRGAQLATAQHDLAARMATLLAGALDDPGADGQVRRLRTLQRWGEQQLTPVVAHYRAWRALQVTQSSDTFEFTVSLQELTSHPPPWEPARRNDVAAPPQSHEQGIEHPRPRSLPQLWAEFGVGLEAEWVLQRRADEEPVVPRSTRVSSWPEEVQRDEIVVRQPDILRMRVVRKVEDGQAGGRTAAAWSRHAVVDEYSRHQVHRLRRTWLGRRSLTLSFDEHGLPTGVSTEGSASLAAGLEAMAGAPKAFAGGVADATSARSNLAAARRVGVEAELARVTGEVALRQQELVAAGLAATAGDAVRLQRLQQYQAILESQTKITNADPALVAELLGSGGLDWYSPPTPAAPVEQSPQVVELVVRGAETPGNQ